MKQTTTFLTMKQNNEKITMITAYDYPSAKHCEEAATDIILVGDSLGMVVLGYDSTIPVTMDDMVHHTKAVKRGAKETFVVADMPFMSYHVSLEQTMANARRLYQEAGANAVKLEGADDVLLAIDALTKAGVPVCAHLGLTPQSVGVLGGYKVQGKDAKAAQKLIDDALKVEQAGAFMLVLECVPHQLATHIAEQLTIPVIGIGAGVDVDGQVLVYHDILRYGSHHLPKFVKAYGNVSTHIHDSLTAYNAEVKAKTFPRPEHQFTMNEETLQQLYGGK